jgi:hypothetical protein
MRPGATASSLGQKHLRRGVLVKLRIASWALSLAVALSVIMASMFSISPDAGRIRLVAAGCSLILAIGLVEQMRHLP